MAVALPGVDCGSAPRRVGLEVLLEKFDEAAHPRGNALARRNKGDHVRPVEAPIRQDALQFAASHERRHVPFRPQSDTESGQRPIANDLSVVAGERGGDTNRIGTTACRLRLAGIIAIASQRHVLVVLAHAQAGVLQQVARVRRDAAATEVGRARAQPTRVSCQQVRHPR